MLRFSVCCSIAIMSASAVSAEEEVGQRNFVHQMDEILVTSGATGASRFDILQGTSVLTGDELDRRVEASLGETLSHLPGISSTYFGPGASRPVIRGLGGDRVSILTGGIGSIDASSTSPDHAVSSDPITAQRIEVIRGPATLMYGSSAVGGVVNVIDGRIPTQVPENNLSGAARIMYGTAAEELSGAASADIAFGKLVFHADGYIRDTQDLNIPGYAESAVLRATEEEHEHEHEEEHEDEEEAYGTLENSDVESKGGAAGLSYVWDQGFFGASFSVHDTNYGVPGGHSHEEHDEHEEEEEEHEEEHEGEEPVRIDLNQKRVDLMGEVNGDFGPFEVAKIRFGYGDYKHVELEGDEIGTTFLNEGWESRLELAQKKHGLLSGSVGLQIKQREFEAIGDEAFVPPSKTTQWGLFAVEKIETGPWSLEAGARFEHQKAKVDTVGLSRSFDGISLSAGAAWSPDDTYLVGLSISRTERLPNAEELFSNGPHIATGAFEIGDPDLSKETAKSAELSFRKRAGRLTGSLSLFYTRYDDFIFEQFTGDEEDGLDVVQFIQTDADFWGGELEIQYLAYETSDYHLHFDLAGDIVRAEERSSNNPLPRIPPKSLTLGMEAFSAFVDGRVEVQLVDNQNRIAAEELPTDGYAVINASISYRPFGTERDLTLTLQGRNLTDVDARNHASFLKDLVPMPGRDIRLSARFGF